MHSIICLPIKTKTPDTRQVNFLPGIRGLSQIGHMFFASVFKIAAISGFERILRSVS